MAFPASRERKRPEFCDDALMLYSGRLRSRLAFHTIWRSQKWVESCASRWDSDYCAWGQSRPAKSLTPTWPPTPP